jgi:predicted small lipoprotein YifL
MSPLSPSRAAYKPWFAALALFILAGCAQQGPGPTPDSYRDSTQSDARHQAQGRSTAQAAPQLVMGFGETGAPRPPQTPEAAAIEASSPTRARALTEPRTFLGTVPCLTGNGACPPSRITLTLAPAGQWRARTVSVNNTNPAAAPNVQQGCWNIVGTQPLRITLQTSNESSLATLAFVNDNVLRIALFQGVTPTLDYSLTRQADIDPIDEIQSQTALQCSP